MLTRSKQKRGLRVRLGRMDCGVKPGNDAVRGLSASFGQ